MCYEVFHPQPHTNMMRSYKCNSYGGSKIASLYEINEIKHKFS